MALSIGRRRTLGLLLALLAPAAPASRAPAQSEAELPSVARPHFEQDGRELGVATAFFVAVERSEAGAVAVTTAHNFDLSELAQAGEVEFRLGRTGRRVAVASGLYSEPGRSFSASGATFRDDYLIFALDAAPSGVRILELESDPGELEGARVRIMGVPATIPQDEDDIFGTVGSAEPTRMEVELDVPTDLRGWGGAPVLRHPEGTLIGIVEAAWPDAETQRLGVAPMGGVAQALAEPLEGGLGRSLAAFRTAEPGRPAADGTATTTAAAEPPAGEAPAGDPSIVGPFAISAGSLPTGPEEGETLLGRAGAVSTQVVVSIEHPSDGAIVGEASGAFVSGRALALLGEFKRFDVFFVLDTSGSTNKMTGTDVNGNGIVGQDGFKGIFGKQDSGDSILAAEVNAARQILLGLDPRNTRVGLVTFAGEPEPAQGGFATRGRGRRAAITEEPLTSNYAQVEKALEHVLERGPAGMTHMAEGLRTSIVELKGYRGGLSTPDPKSEKIVLFFTDGQPTLPYDAMFKADNVKAVLRAADLAHRAGVRVHSFAIGPDALEGPIAVVEMASRTDGFFTPVRNPGDLVEVIENVSFANIETLEIRNLTSRDPASELVANADGSFGALVPVQLGRNRIEVMARAADGSEARAEVTVSYAPGVPRPELPRELVAQRNRLLERRLVDLRRGRIESERARAEQARKALQLDIERERAAARERADRQRKELELEVPDEP